MVYLEHVTRKMGRLKCKCINSLYAIIRLIVCYIRCITEMHLYCIVQNIKFKVNFHCTMCHQQTNECRKQHIHTVYE